MRLISARISYCLTFLLISLTYSYAASGVSHFSNEFCEVTIRPTLKRFPLLMDNILEVEIVNKTNERLAFNKFKYDALNFILFYEINGKEYALRNFVQIDYRGGSSVEPNGLEIVYLNMNWFKSSFADLIVEGVIPSGRRPGLLVGNYRLETPIMLRQENCESIKIDLSCEFEVIEPTEGIDKEIFDLLWYCYENYADYDSIHNKTKEVMLHYPNHPYVNTAYRMYYGASGGLNRVGRISLDEMYQMNKHWTFFILKNSVSLNYGTLGNAISNLTSMRFADSLKTNVDQELRDIYQKHKGSGNLIEKRFDFYYDVMEAEQTRAKDRANKKGND